MIPRTPNSSNKICCHAHAYAPAHVHVLYVTVISHLVGAIHRTLEQADGRIRGQLGGRKSTGACTGNVFAGMDVSQSRNWGDIVSGFSCSTMASGPRGAGTPRGGARRQRRGARRFRPTHRRVADRQRHRRAPFCDPTRSNMLTCDDLWMASTKP